MATKVEQRWEMEIALIEEFCALVKRNMDLRSYYDKSSNKVVEEMIQGNIQVMLNLYQTLRNSV